LLLLSLSAVAHSTWGGRRGFVNWGADPVENDDAASTSDAFKAGLSALVLHFANELVFAPHGGCPSLLGLVSVIILRRILPT
jgi:hypothetical protein